MGKIVHKIGPQKVTVYAGLGQYIEVPSPLCVGAKEVYKGKTFLVHRLKKYVTCKHCLKALNNITKK
jgi:hypothetical protein